MDELITHNERAVLRHLMGQADGDYEPQASVLKMWAQRGLRETELVPAERRLAQMHLIDLENVQAIAASGARLTQAGRRKVCG